MPLLDKLLPSPARARLRAVATAPRTRKWVIRLGIFLLVFGALGLFVAPPIIHRQLEVQLSRLLSRPVTVGSISFNPYTLRLEADRLHIGEPGGTGDFVDLGKFVVRLSWSSLFRLKPVMGELLLDAPQIHIVRRDPQTFNFSDLVEKFSAPSPTPPKPDAKPLQFYVGNIHVENGLIDFDDRALGQHHVVDRLQIGVPFVANLPSKVDVFIQPQLQARVDGSPLQITGEAKPFSSALTSDIAIKLQLLDLPKLVSYVPAKLPVQLNKGRLSTDLDIQFAKTAQQASVRLSGTVDLRQLALADAAGNPLFSADLLHLAAGSIEPLGGVFQLADIRIEHPVVDLVRNADGTLNLAQLGSKPAQSDTTPSTAPAPSAAAPTKAAPPPNFSLHQFTLDNGEVHLQDLQAGARLGLSQLAVNLSDLSTQAHAPAHYTVHVALDQGGTIGTEGTLNLADHQLAADLSLEQLALNAFQPYLAQVLAARLSQGTAGAKVAAKADWSGPAFGLQLGTSELHLDGLRLEPAHGGTPELTLGHAGVALEALDLAARQARVSSVKLEGLQVNAERAPDGSINLLQQPAPKTAPAKSPDRPAQPRKPATTAPAQAPWHYSVDAIELDKSGASFVDHGTSQPVSLTVSALQAKLQHFGSDTATPLQFELSGKLQQKGALQLQGSGTLEPLKLSLQVDGKQLDVAAVAPYFDAQLNAVIASALLDVKGTADLARDRQQWKVRYAGDVGLGSVRMLDKATSDLFAGWRTLSVTKIKAAYDERGTDVQLGRIALNNFYARILLNANGRLNLSDFMAQENAPTTSLTRSNGPAAPAAPAAPQPTAPSPAGNAPPLHLGFGQILLHVGKIDYSDSFIKPNFSAHLVEIEGDIGAFGTESTQPARVAVLAKLNGNGPVSINGSVNPLVKPPFLDMTATTRDVELSNFTAYSTKYAGYPIVKGKLNVDLHYMLDQNRLNANNHLFIDQLTFGDHVDSPTATNLPVRLAISLLKDSRGEIDVNVPVSGSLDDPQFSAGSLIWHAFLNIIEKAVTSPFSLLAGAFGGSEELGYVAFQPGSAALGDTETKKLDTLAKALSDRPGIKLDLTARVDPALDTPGLKQAAVDRQVKRQKLKDLVGKGQSVDVESVTLAPAEYDKYLRRAYDDASIKKPRNFVGLAKSLPPDQMKQLLLDNVTVGELDLNNLAQQRAGAVQGWFQGKVDASRIFVVAPRMDAAGIADKGPSTRVEFSLK
ncbi:MAG: DUF748 domain-containing protein [Nevskia sp.]|nr:DUF748 domain-containing protein [Nevskia sp.]